MLRAADFNQGIEVNSDLHLVATIIRAGLNEHRKDKKSNGIVDRCACSAVSLNHDKHQATVIAKMLDAERLLK